MNKYVNQLTLLICLLCLCCFFAACGGGQNETTVNSLSPQSELTETASEHIETASPIETSEESPIKETDTAPESSVTDTLPAETSSAVMPETKTPTTEAPATEPTEATPVILEIEAEMEPLQAPPAVKEVLRVPHHEGEGGIFTTRTVKTAFAADCVAVVDENNIYILNYEGGKVIHYRDGNHVRDIPLPRGREEQCHLMEVDENKIYVIGYEYFYVIDQETGSFTRHEYVHKWRSIHYRPGYDFNGITWMDGLLLLIRYQRSLDPQSNYTFDIENQRFDESDKGWQDSYDNKKDCTEVKFDGIVWRFLNIGDSIKLPVAIDQDDSIIVDSHDWGKGERKIRKYSSSGALEWEYDYSEDKYAYLPYKTVCYGHDGKVYYLQILADEMIIRQLNEAEP